MARGNTPSSPGPVTVVTGLQFGDEGKGQVADVLARDHDIVVRANGGANAGHTVRIGGEYPEKFALHLLPLGVLTPGCANVVANGVALDPTRLIREIDGLSERGVDLDGRLFVSDRAHLVLRWHRLEDRLRDRLSGIGTTGRGIGPAYADKAFRDTAFRVGDLRDEAAFERGLGQVLRLKNAVLGAISDLVGEEFQPFAAGPILEARRRWWDRLEPFVTDTAEWLHRAIDAGRSVLVEGAHAAELDVEQGTYPFVTSSVCLPNGVPAAAGIPARFVGRVVGVVKAYTSRVGAGPFPTEISGPEADRLRARGNEFGTTTGRPRRVGALDLTAVARAARIGGVTEIALTGLGILFDDPVRESADLVERVAREVGPVRYLAIGPGRDQLIERE